MKKAILIALVIVLTLCIFSASASEPDNSKKQQTARTYSYRLPDPYPLLGISDPGELVSQNYEFSDGFFCDCFYFDIPEDINAFCNSYIRECRNNGFTVYKYSLDGYDGFIIQCNKDHIGSNNDLYSLLFPDVENYVVLLIQRGMRHQIDPNHFIAPDNDCPSCISGYCSVCEGAGYFTVDGDGYGAWMCFDCNATGDCVQCNGNGYLSDDMILQNVVCTKCNNGICPECYGLGMVDAPDGTDDKKTCQNCDGFGLCPLCNY